MATTSSKTSATERAIRALNGIMDELSIAARSLGNEITAKQQTAEMPTTIGNATLNLYDTATSRLGQAVPNQPDVACCRGCTACCYLPVRTDEATVLRLVDHVRRTWTPSQQAALKRRVNEHIAAVERAPHAPPADRPPCPFLIGDECSVHAQRPLVCRAMNSFDVEDCLDAAHTGKLQRALRGDPVPSMVAHALQKGVNEALSQEGFSSEPVDFTPALKYALETPQASQRWIDSKKLMS